MNEDSTKDNEPTAEQLDDIPEILDGPWLPNRFMGRTKGPIHVFNIPAHHRPIEQLDASEEETRKLRFAGVVTVETLAMDELDEFGYRSGIAFERLQQLHELASRVTAS